MSAPLSTVSFWTPDDTEESVLGTEWHQNAIMSLCSGLRAVAQEQGWPWHVGSQITLVAWHPDGSPWRPLPDIMVHPQAGAQPREEMDAATEGLPALIIEVASPSTVASDLHVDPPRPRRREAKAHEYLAWPIAEYLVFDLFGRYVPGQVRAWHVVEGRVQPWLPNAEGRYHSALGVSFQPEGPYLRIYDPAGRPALLEHENVSVRHQLIEQAAEAERQAQAERQAREQVERENAALRAEIMRLRGEDRG